MAVNIRKRITRILMASQIEQQTLRVFQALLDAHKEGHCLLAVNTRWS